MSPREYTSEILWLQLKAVLLQMQEMVEGPYDILLRGTKLEQVSFNVTHEEVRIITNTNSRSARTVLVLPNPSLTGESLLTVKHVRFLLEPFYLVPKVRPVSAKQLLSEIRSG